MRPYIKRVEIHNYKTHRNTKITLSEGINSIVGPNGVGKSNIVEAIIFCLGERSPKNLRVSSFNELIYNFRRDLEVSVTLTIVDNDGKEHKFKRIYSPKRGHIYRYNGKNVTRTSYLINLLKLGGRGFKYVYIKQGDITRWADATPREIRDIIHEALGIKQYNQKRKEAIERLKEAEAKLEGIQANYQEMQKIIYEFRDLLVSYDTIYNINSLKSIIDRYILSEKHKELSDKIRRYIEIDKKLAKKEGRIKTKLNILEEKLETLRIKASKILDTYETYEGQSRTLNREILELINSENRLIRDLREGKLTRIKMEINYLKNNIIEERNKTREEAREIKNTLKILNTFEKERDRLRNEINSKIKKIEEIESTLETLEKTKRSLLNTYKEDIDKNLKKLLEIELIRSRKNEIMAEIEDINRRIKNYQKSIEKLKAKRREHMSEIKRIKEYLDKHKKRIREYKRKIDRVENEISNAYKLLNKLDYILNHVALDGIHENKYYKDANRVIEVASKIRVDGVYGVLSDLIKGPKTTLSLLRDIDIKGWYSIVVKDRDTALKVLEIARDLGKEIHVKISNVEATKDLDDTSVIYILKYPKKIENLLINLFGDINRVNGIDEALDTVNKGKRAIHTDGAFLIYKGGVISPGKILIKLPRDIDTILNVRNKFLSIINKREEYLVKLKKTLDDMKKEETNLLSKTMTLKLTINFINKNIKFFSNIIKHLETKKKLKEDMLRGYEEIKSGDNEISHRISELDRKIEAIVEDRKLIRKEIEELTREIHNIDGEIAKLRGRIDIFRKLNRERLSKIEKLKRNIENLEKDIPQLVEKIRETSLELKRIRQEKARKMKELKNIGNKLQKYRKLNTKINEQISKILNNIKKLRAHEIKIKEKRSITKGNMLMLQRTIDDLKSKLEEYHGKLIQLMDKDEAKRIYNTLEDELKKLPQSSELVEKWYLERLEPYKVYSMRRDELIREKEEILNFINEIDNKREDIFYRGFKDIKERFYKMFKEVYPDGEVEIRLERDGDIDSDVLVYVQFLGKPKILLSTASGGEKTSLILLLLLSIYSVNKDAVFILDEIDAHMDLRVVDDIANIIKAQRKYSQITLVTLPGHDSMINIADIIIPVTFTNQHSRVFPIKREFLDKIRGG